MPATGRPQDLQLEPQRLADNRIQGRPQGHILRRRTHICRILPPGGREIWLLRGLQVPLRRETPSQHQQNRHLPRRQRLRRVPCGYRIMPV